MRSPWLLPLFVMALAGPGPLARADLEGPTLYRLDAGSSFQRGCLDPDYCEVPVPVPLLGTFVLTPAGKDFDRDTYEMSEIHWHDGFNGNLLLLGDGSYVVRSPSAVFRVFSANLIGSVRETRFEGHADGAGDFSRLDITMSATLGPGDEGRLVLKASPVTDAEIQWFRLQAKSAYGQRPCHGTSAGPRPLTGTFGLIELQPGLSDQAVVSVRWRAVSRDQSDPSDLFLTDFGILSGRDMQLILSEDSRRPILFTGHADVSSDGLRLEAVLAGAAGCEERMLVLLARRILR